MKAFILAAGLGQRLTDAPQHPPKCLLEFAGKSSVAATLGYFSSLRRDR